MAKIQRYEGNLQAFASAATGQERVIFGNDDSPPVQSDDLTTNINSNFARGWGVLPLGNKPPREWFNAVAFATTQLSAYQHQVGVPEWDDEQEYHEGSIVNVGGVLYSSLENDNVGNDPLSPGVSWRTTLKEEQTTQQLISSTSGDDRIVTNGYYASGDGGGGEWLKTGSTGTPSQSPAQTGNGTITDASGAVWRLVKSGYIDVRAFGVTSSGDQSDALQSAFDTALSFGRASLSFANLSSVTIQSGVTVRDNTSLIMGQCEVIVDYTETGVSQAVLLGNGVSVDNLDIRLTSGNTFRRVLVVKSDCRLDKVSVSSDDQIDNLVAKSDGAVQFDGSRIQCGLCTVSNFDLSVCVLGNIENSIKKIICKSYLRGVYIDSEDSSDFEVIRCIGASPNASHEPGHNGVLIENCTRLSFGTVYVENSGEHAVRIGGDASDFTGDISFGEIYAYKPGQCGFKLSPDGADTCRRVSVGVLTAVDCADTNTTGSNEDVCRIEHSIDVTIGQINGFIQDKVNCGNDGLFISGSEKVLVGAMNITNPKRSMIYIDDYKGNARDITVGNFHLNECDGTAIVVNHPNENLDHMRFGPGYMRDTPANQPVVSVTSNSPPAGGVFHPLIFEFDVEVTSWTSPGSVTKEDLITKNTTTAKIYNDMRVRQ